MSPFAGEKYAGAANVGRTFIYTCQVNESDNPAGFVTFTITVRVPLRLRVGVKEIILSTSVMPGMLSMIE